ncbi:alanine racemase [Aldersonia sp. NBC_00410]|uniref:alanine racemase n=1 Tax=Aldersonia sp. NBC_00410 TaxID=2975954 RepID=UPI002256BED1|nr:alanine racemase [Aldersonia sp. NBC_00410]MCX5043697.1 alanine racemase [Aldersonia sp. NBC_00410]
MRKARSRSATAVIERLTRATADLDPPLAAIDMPTLRANAADLIRRAGSVPIRLASKSVRCRTVLDEALTPQRALTLAGAGGFRGIMSYSLREAIWLAGNGHTDILMGYPTTDRAALRDYAAAPELVAAIVLMVDDIDQLGVIRGSVGNPELRPRVCLDVDASLRVGPVHLGVRRSPLRTPAQAAALAAAALQRGFDVVGVMTYEAQIAGLPDTRFAVRRLKWASARDMLRRRGAVVAAVQNVAGPLEIVNSGGSGSIEVSVADEVVTEVTAGSGLYVPTLFDDYRSFTPHPAMYFATSVLRRPAPGIATAFSGGYIASGPAGDSRVPQPAWPPGMKLIASEGAGEVQTPLTGGKAGELAIGDRVWFRHAKAGELCERFDRVHLVEADGRRTTVPTYRGEGQCFG